MWLEKHEQEGEEWERTAEGREVVVWTGALTSEMRATGRF